jgi:large subunit ribosomal protein L9
MDVILLKDVDKVGLRGDVVSVARGYMRNYLEPRRLAEPATPARVAELGKREAERAKHEARSFEQAQEIAETLRKTVLRFEAPAGPRGVLFGSVTATDVADELWRARKIRVDRRKVDLRDPIKRVGKYEVAIDVFQDVRVEVKTLVVPQGGELPPDQELEAWAAEDAAAQAPPAEAETEDDDAADDDAVDAEGADDAATSSEEAAAGSDDEAMGEPAYDAYDTTAERRASEPILASEEPAADGDASLEPADDGR